MAFQPKEFHGVDVEAPQDGIRTLNISNVDICIFISYLGPFPFAKM